MRRYLFVAFVGIALLGCDRKEAATASAPEPSAAAATDSPRSFMAYEHTLRLDVEAQQVVAIHRSTEAACRAQVVEQCVVLESHLDSSEGYASASLKIRARPDGVRALMAGLASQGDVIHQSVKAEDLASPIEDSDRKLAMLEDYRARLEGLRGEADGDVDALIKVNKALAKVQSEIESLSGEQAHLLQRVETEILHVSLSSLASASFWQPISSALSDFGGDLSEGISSAITGVAFLLPWSVVLLVFLWIGRKLLRRRMKVKAPT